MKNLQTQKKLQSFMEAWNNRISKHHASQMAYYQGSEIIIRPIHCDQEYISSVTLREIALEAYSLDLFIDPYPMGLSMYPKTCIIVKDI